MSFIAEHFELNVDEKNFISRRESKKKLIQLFREDFFCNLPELLLFAGDDKGRKTEKLLVFNHFLGRLKEINKLRSSEVGAKEVDLKPFKGSL